MFSEAHQRGVPPVTSAVDCDAVRVSDPLLDDPARAVGDIVLDPVPRLTKACFHVFSAESRGSAKIDLQYGKAVAGKKLNFSIEML